MEAVSDESIKDFVKPFNKDAVKKESLKDQPMRKFNILKNYRDE